MNNAVEEAKRTREAEFPLPPEDEPPAADRSLPASVNVK